MNQILVKVQQNVPQPRKIMKYLILFYLFFHLLQIIICNNIHNFIINSDELNENSGIGKTQFEPINNLFLKSQLKSSDEGQRNATINLIKRILPNEYAQYFDVHINFSLPLNYFKVYKNSSEINSNLVYITASNGVSACRGLNYYLKYYLKGQISWDGSQLNNIKLPWPDANFEIETPNAFIYYQNVCTHSYSFTWWTYTEWRKHLDWMALNGINLFLAPIQEEIWMRMYKVMNLTDGEIAEHFAGPAFLAWQRMGNIRGWGGPLSENFRKFSLLLQKQIIAGARDLGMMVALPGFAGHVPKALKTYFPNSTYTIMERWNHFTNKFCCPLYLDPTDSLFKCIGEWIIMEVIQEYGTDHIYFSDPFNEIQPSYSTREYLHNASSAIYQAMQSVDNEAVWLLQGWMFVKNPFWSDELIRSFLTANPPGTMLILDLQSEQHPQYQRTKNFYGQPFIWCMLHNFGGTLGMHGSLNIINNRALDAKIAENSTMVGFGITPEGINQNYMLYDFALEMGWTMLPVYIDDWLLMYCESRYGVFDADVHSAWKILASSVYNFHGLQQMRGKYIFNRRPSLKLKPWTWYNTSDVTVAWEYFLKASDRLNTSELYLNDLVDITRQYLQLLTDRYYIKIIKLYKSKKSLTELIKYIQEFEAILLDIDRLLQTNSNFLLGNWLDSANKFAVIVGDSDLKDVYEDNARYQITWWGPNGEIVDYANKQWAGVVKYFFLPRWQIFNNRLVSSFKNHVKINPNELKLEIMQNAEYPFIISRYYSNETTGNPIEISKYIFQRWYIDNNSTVLPEIPIK